MDDEIVVSLEPKSLFHAKDAHNGDTMKERGAPEATQPYSALIKELFLKLLNQRMYLQRRQLQRKINDLVFWWCFLGLLLYLIAPVEAFCKL